MQSALRARQTVKKSMELSGEILEPEHGLGSNGGVGSPARISLGSWHFPACSEAQHIKKRRVFLTF
jgi:hypothetical protein